MSATATGLRTTEAYRKMDAYHAVELCEQLVDARDEEQLLAAWQWLHDTALAYKLQGCYGRMAVHLLAEGEDREMSAKPYLWQHVVAIGEDGRPNEALCGIVRRFRKAKSRPYWNLDIQLTKGEGVGKVITSVSTCWVTAEGVAFGTPGGDPRTNAPICEHCGKPIIHAHHTVFERHSGPSTHELHFHDGCLRCPKCGTNGPHYCPADIATS